jgi:metallo-beta-lactamase class B
MNRYPALIFLLLFAQSANAEWVADTPKYCAWCEDWNAPQTPYPVHGNTWCAGTKGLTSILVVTDTGLILIDGGLAQSAPLIDQNIRLAGFDPLDIKYILNSHAHYDHAGGMGALQRLNNAQGHI